MVLTTNPRSTTNNIRLPSHQSHQHSKPASNIGESILIIQSHEIDSSVQVISSNHQTLLKARNCL
ncbi:hypothetical protein CGCSCA5_v005999 [Colletotrichum siamense]|nr:hypothetical protein CGCSCA5_v005999 [Colletotrichum siamense]